MIRTPLAAPSTPPTRSALPALPSALAMPVTLAALALLALLTLCVWAPARAADLDRGYALSGEPYDEAPRAAIRVAPARARVLVLPAQDPDVLGDPALVVERPVGAVRLPPPPRVGGAFLYVPGLNGPSGPPAYPLLPFAFGYGY